MKLPEMSNNFESIDNLSSKKRELFELLLRQGREKQPRAIQALPRRKGVNTFPVSFAQRRLWFLDQFEPGNPAYNITSAVRLIGRLNASAVEQSVAEVIRRHEVVRMTFDAVGGEPVQQLGGEVLRHLPVIDLSRLSQGDGDLQAKALVELEARRPFNLTKGPLLRCGLARLAGSEHIVILCMHHIISDGWSIGVLITEMGSLCTDYLAGSPSQLAEPSVQYADFAHWQRRRLQGEALEAELGYWKQRLAGAPSVLQLPTDRQRPAIQTFRGANAGLSLSRSLSDKLRNLSRQENATLFMTLLAAFKTLLYHYTCEDDIIVGTNVANRGRPEVEGLIGFFVNMVVLRTDCSGNPEFLRLLDRVKHVALEAYLHQDLPFEKLVEELQLARDLSYPPLFQVVFSLQNAPMSVLRLPGLALSMLEIKNQTAKYDLVLNMWEDEHGLKGALEYNTDLFDHSTAAHLLRNFERLLSVLTAQPNARLNELDVFSGEEKLLLEQPTDIEELEESFAFRTTQPSDECRPE